MIITEFFIDSLKEFEAVSKASGEALTHFIPPTLVRQSPINGTGRFAAEWIPKGALAGIIGGILTNISDDKISMPISRELYLNQLFMNQRASTNHSCEPSLSLKGFNRLIAKRAIKVDDELTVDYGSLCVGKGHVLIENCLCGAKQCRKTIKTNDYLLLPKDQLGAYPLYWTLNGVTKEDT